MPELRRWANPTGDEWVCGASDHGPFCRLCWPVDGTLAAILDNVDQGYMEFVEVDRDGEPRFRLTPAGEARANALIDGRDSTE